MTERREDRVAGALAAALERYGSPVQAGDGFSTYTINANDMPRIAHRVLAAIDPAPAPACDECGGRGVQFSHYHNDSGHAITRPCPICGGKAIPGPADDVDPGYTVAPVGEVFETHAPGPVAAVSEGHPLVSPELFDVGLDDLADEIERTFSGARDGWEHTPDELLELRQYIKDVYRDTYAAVLAARTTARAPEHRVDIEINAPGGVRLICLPAEPTEAEVEAAWKAYKAHPTPWPTPHPARPHDGYAEELEQARIQGMRAALIAARNAGEGGAT